MQQRLSGFVSSATCDVQGNIQQATHDSQSELIVVTLKFPDRIPFPR
jgi:hypothetical protein